LFVGKIREKRKKKTPPGGKVGEAGRCTDGPPQGKKIAKFLTRKGCGDIDVPSRGLVKGKNVTVRGTRDGGEGGHSMQVIRVRI